MDAMIRALVVCVTLPCFCACSLFGPRMQTITVSSDPDGAAVLLNGSRVGETPLRTQVPRREELLVEVRKPGYQSEHRTAGRALSTLGILDVIGGWMLLVPFIGLASSAAWEHDPETFAFVMTPVEKGTPAAAPAAAP